MKKRTGRKVITVILVVIVCMFALFPFVWMISTSFKTAGEVYSNYAGIQRDAYNPFHNI